MLFCVHLMAIVGHSQVCFFPSIQQVIFHFIPSMSHVKLIGWKGDLNHLSSKGSCCTNPCMHKYKQIAIMEPLNQA